MILKVEIPFPQIDPAAFTIPLPEMDLGPLALGPFPIRWYALAYILGLLIGWWYASRIASRPQLWGATDKSPVTKADIDLGDPEMQARPWRWLRVRISQLLDSTPTFTPDGRRIMSTRLGRALYPTPPPKRS